MVTERVGIPVAVCWLIEMWPCRDCSPLASFRGQRVRCRQQVQGPEDVPASLPPLLFFSNEVINWSVAFWKRREVQLPKAESWISTFISLSYRPQKTDHYPLCVLLAKEKAAEGRS